ncbi:hypothetical protein ZIOFF_071613 [Zingiber officinale]|uniref:Retrovirus-related Pol polyprotein from transposon TNT 1-94-like beta-barrel domain-containing protein n=1 Tax=Zingiber officinale TaxID=94328 RepID=A0A8J5C1T6_ZINOF|nr:hypothetical protein ZIOFF_071613 [Zingiber officinale]
MAMENPIMSLFANNTLTRENFPKWKSNINIMLVSENNRFVLTEECPPVPPANAARAVREPYDYWITSNNKAKAYMLASMFDAQQDGAQGAEMHGAIIDEGTQVSIILNSLPSDFIPFSSNYIMNKLNYGMTQLLNELQTFEAISGLVKNKAEANVVGKPNSSKEACLVEDDSSFWIIDLEATNHVYSSIQLLSSSKELADGELTLRVGNGALASVKAVGVARLNFKNKYLVLNDVYFILGFCRNLISISILHEQLFGISFYVNGISILRNGLEICYAVYDDCICQELSEVEVKEDRHSNILLCWYLFLIQLKPLAVPSFTFLNPDDATAFVFSAPLFHRLPLPPPFLFSRAAAVDDPLWLLESHWSAHDVPKELFLSMDRFGNAVEGFGDLFEGEPRLKAL